MKKKKIFILLPDGIGLRNFAFTTFYDVARKEDFEITFWNSTPFSLKKMGLNEKIINNPKTHPFTDTLKKARKHIELNLNIKRTNDPVYNSYRFLDSNNSIKAFLKNIITKLIIIGYSSEKGLNRLRRIIQNKERSTNYYSDCINTLKQEKPDFVFCTNQRIVTAIAPLIAARDLGIPTATFIFSWDNLPKATLVVEVDYYFVWSDFMKNELMEYYPHINANQIQVTGTPQFEAHFDMNILETKSTFFATHGLDQEKKYICFSGDDETTSPDDPAYLEDVAEAIKSLNRKGLNLGIIFRRCPVDFSTRYDVILNDYKNLITEIAPKWIKVKDSWDSIFPSKEDTLLLSNTIAHTEGVINLGSSMVFDYAAFNKPCVYLNYNQKTSSRANWDIHDCYKYVHFRTMPDNAVIWLNRKEEIELKIENLIKDSSTTIKKANKWFSVIHKYPHNSSSERILQAINHLISNKVH